MQGKKPADRLKKGEPEGSEYDFEDKIDFSVFPCPDSRVQAVQQAGAVLFRPVKCVACALYPYTHTGSMLNAFSCVLELLGW